MGGVTASKPFQYPSADDLMPIALLSVGWTWLCMVDTLSAGSIRKITDTPAPRMDGPPSFLRTQRAQMNTVEQAVSFLPAFWSHALLCDPTSAAIAGGAYIGLRYGYSFAYRANSKTLKACCTLPCYFLIAYLGYGPVHNLLLKRRLGMSHWAGVGAMVAFHVAASAGTIAYCRSGLRAIAAAEGDIVSTSGEGAKQ